MENEKYRKDIVT